MEASTASAPAAAQGKLSFIKTIPRRRLIAFAVGAAVILFLGARVVYAMLTTESTDDAFVTAHVHTISSHIAGTVAEVMVNDHQAVKKGDVLVRLDKRDYEVALKIAQANYSKAHKDLGRLGGMHDFLPDERPILDTYTANALTSEAELQRAQLQMEYTNIVAPEDGVIGKRTVETGQMIQPAQALMALVEPNPWIIANFKESQVVHIRPGQEVSISVDAISGHEFKGKIESIAPASGSTFSLLPPDNATGNFTKIVQRIPVKIVFDPDSVRGFENRIAAGMSTEVTVHIH